MFDNPKVGDKVTRFSDNRVIGFTDIVKVRKYKLNAKITLSGGSEWTANGSRWTSEKWPSVRLHIAPFKHEHFQSKAQFEEERMLHYRLLNLRIDNLRGVTHEESTVIHMALNAIEKRQKEKKT